MTEHRRAWLEKYGLITAICTVLTVAMMVAGGLITISRWTGAIEFQARQTCEEIKTLKDGYTRLPERYVTQPEHNDLQRRVAEMKQDIKDGNDDIKKAVTDLRKEIGGKLDRHMEANPNLKR